MPLPDPNAWSNFNLSSAKDQKIFQHQLITVIAALLNPGFVSGQLNGMGLLTYGALKSSTTAIGSVATNQTVNCNNAATVALSLTLTASLTLTLNNLGPGVPIEIEATTTGNFTLKLSATQPGGAAYGTIQYASAGALTNMITTGWVSGAAATRTFHGVSLPSGVLVFAFV